MRSSLGGLLLLGAACGARAGGAACAENPGCAGLTGDCCPSAHGVQLGCCSAEGAPPPGAHRPDSAQPSASPSPPAASPASPSPPYPPSPPPEPARELLDGDALGDDSPAFEKAAPHSQQPTSIWGSHTSAPLPTNRWWQNIVLQDGDALGEGVVASMPYLLKARPDGLHVGLSAPKVVAADSVSVPFTEAVHVGAEGLPDARAVAAHDQLSVTLRWGDHDGGSMAAPLVRGMPLVTLEFSDLAPRVTFAASSVARVDGHAVPASLSSDRYEIELASGDTWLVYVSKESAVHVDERGISFDGKMSGAVRLGLAPSEESKAVLDKHRRRYPTGGKVRARAAADRARLTFAWATRGDGPLLMMALPHHVDAGISGGEIARDVTHESMKGGMVGVSGDTWTITERLPTIGWAPPRPIDAARAPAVREALKSDASKPLVAVDPYGAGKEMAALGRLAVIADELGEAGTAEAIRERLAGALDSWLEGKNADALRYEPTWGGVAPANGLADPGADFGAGWYNDHHFHYGYFLYAAAAVGRKDPAWLRKRMGAILHLVRDIANPSARDRLYPQQRHKDWYVGHSWAAGLFPSASGRNQESCSEAANAWYSLALLGEAAGDGRLRGLGRLMLATEARAYRKYWLMGAGSSAEKSPIYPSKFAENGMVAVVWSTKADKATWFGANIECVLARRRRPPPPPDACYCIAQVRVWDPDHAGHPRDGAAPRSEVDRARAIQVGAV